MSKATRSRALITQDLVFPGKDSKDLSLKESSTPLSFGQATDPEFLSPQLRMIVAGSASGCVLEPKLFPPGLSYRNEIVHMRYGAGFH